MNSPSFPFSVYSKGKYTAIYWLIPPWPTPAVLERNMLHGDVDDSFHAVRPVATFVLTLANFLRGRGVLVLCATRV